MDREHVIRESRSMMGAVPEFINRIPDPHLSWMWESMRDMQLQPGTIPARYQQLIMLAVSTHAKCKHCTDLHTETAKALGASTAEIAETALLTSHTSALSHYLGGTQYDFVQFKREVRAFCMALSGNGITTAPKPPTSGRNVVRT